VARPARARPGVAAPEPRLRLFVALELPEATRAALAGWREEALNGLGLRLPPAESLHVTLAFLGGRPPADVSGIAAALTPCAAPLTGLALGAALALPRRRPRVLAVAIEDPGGELAALQSRVAGVLVAGGWLAPETRPYRPHITVARVPRGGRLTDVPPPPPPEPFAAEAVTLFRSHPGSRYEALARYACR
jgi:2'-5' RNA ligase